MKKMIICSMFVLMSTYPLLAQDYALFIHGFEGSADSWESSDTPELMVEMGVINDFDLLVYETEEVAAENGLQSLIQEIAGIMQARGSGRWVLIGHSLGGLISRVAYEGLKDLPGIEVSAVITLGTPHQGARVAHVSIGYEPGYINAEPYLDEFIDRVSLPVQNGEFGSLIEWIAGANAIETLEDLVDVLPQVKDELRVFERPSVEYQVKDIIGLNGSFINLINSDEIADPPNMRSVIGVEKRFAPIRTAAELLEDKSGQELKYLEDFDRLRWFYRANANYFRTLSWLNVRRWFGYDNKNSRKADRWDDGRTAMDNIDRTWGIMIDSFRLYQTTRMMMVNICEDGMMPGEGHEFDPGVPDSAYDGRCWIQQEVELTFLIPTKNDVLIGPDYAVWNPGEDPEDDNGVNSFYSDTESDGGYNHFELRRMKRAYSLEGVFEQGDYAPPMHDATTWLEELWQNI